MQRTQSKPLKGKKVIITRPVDDQADIARRLKSLGANCHLLPTIAIRPKHLPAAQAAQLIRTLHQYDWVIFTSYHGVEALERLGRRLRKRLSALVSGSICAIGPRTAQAVRQTGLKPKLIPEEFSKEGITQLFGWFPVKNKKILIPRSNLGKGDPLAASLRRRGAWVREVILYDTVPIAIVPRKLRTALEGADAVTFTSASTAQAFLKALRRAGLRIRTALNGTKAVAIGPATAKVLKSGGIPQCTLPRRSWTIDGLIRAVVEATR